MRIFGGQKMFAIMETLKVEETMPIESAIVSRSIQSAQKKVETYHFDIRKHVLEYDDVMNQQRELFYRQRRRVLEGKNVYEDINFMIEQEIDRLMGSYINPEMPLEEYDEDTMRSLLKAIHSTIPQLSYIGIPEIKGIKYESLFEKLKEASQKLIVDMKKKSLISIIML